MDALLTEYLAEWSMIARDGYIVVHKYLSVAPPKLVIHYTDDITFILHSTLMDDARLTENLAEWSLSMIARDS